MKTNISIIVQFALLLCVALCAVPGGISAQESKIIATPHNLSVTGSGNIKATVEQEICVFCHLPHNSLIAQPLWSHVTPDGPFVTYSSSTLEGTPETPGGTSRLCLSCHDGSVAVGDIVGERITLQGVNADGTIPSGPFNLSYDLSDDHPISILLDPAIPGIIPPTPPIKLDADGRVQCSSCHDAHNNQYGNFLVIDNLLTMCTSCHQIDNWPGSTHEQVTASSDGCLSCHDEHTANSPERLLKNNEENLCFSCHQGGIASDIKSIFDSKPYQHPVTLVSGIHDPIETPYEVRQTPPWLPEISPTAVRHSECVDCHNPHTVSESMPLVGVWGIDSQGNRVDQVAHEYEICFKCHGDSQNKPVGAQNLVDVFQSSNPSFHPVESAGQNLNVPSLLYPYDVSSIIACTDCHGSSDVDGLSGPHGSDYRHILKKNYTQQDYTPEGYFEYELCYSCHDRNSILGNNSFRKHRKHIDNEDTPCWVCHSAHGSTTNTHLIDFDPSVVTPSSSGRLEFIDDGTFRGRCYLTCHEKDHDPKRYMGM